MQAAARPFLPRILWPSPNGWIISKPVDVAAHDSAYPTSTEPLEKHDPYDLLRSMRTDDFRGADGAIVCRDFLDRRWCFPLSITETFFPDRIHVEILTPVFWRPSKRFRGAPAWAISDALWPEGYALFIGQTA